MDTLKKTFTDAPHPALNPAEPFNAPCNNSDEVLPVANTISLYSPSGLYPKEDRTDNDAFLKYFKNQIQI